MSAFLDFDLNNIPEPEKLPTDRPVRLKITNVREPKELPAGKRDQIIVDLNSSDHAGDYEQVTVWLVFPNADDPVNTKYLLLNRIKEFCDGFGISYTSGKPDLSREALIGKQATCKLKREVRDNREFVVIDSFEQASGIRL